MIALPVSGRYTPDWTLGSSANSDGIDWASKALKRGGSLGIFRYFLDRARQAYSLARAPRCEHALDGTADQVLQQFIVLAFVQRMGGQPAGSAVKQGGDGMAGRQET
ncbi:hypothetical protein D9M71_713170 [compost metagenome]